MNLELRGHLLRFVEGDVAGDASQRLAVVHPIQAARGVLHGQRVVVDVRIVDRGPLVGADRLVV